jgi:hypothetical protein
MQRISPIFCVFWLTACASAAPSSATVPVLHAVAPTRHAVAPTRHADRPSSSSQSKPVAPVQPFNLEQSEEAEDAILRKAASLYQEFIDRAGADPAFAQAVQRSRQRMADIEAILVFRDQGRRERARQRGDAK